MDTYYPPWYNPTYEEYLEDSGVGFGGTAGSGTGATGDPPPINTGDTGTVPYVPAAPAPFTGCTGNPSDSGGSLTGTVQRFEDLPAGATTGQVYKVAGDATGGFTSYYVRRNGTVWDETVKPGLRNTINPQTMPHALVRKADGTFELAPFCWHPRRVGDSTNNPAPLFIGRSIRDTFFYQNRLGFLVDESVVLSAAGDYGEFWRRTVLDALEGDPLAVSATSTDVALLDSAVPFNDGIMLFSAKRQFSLSNGEAGTTATSLEIVPVTSYSMSRGVRPIPMGDQVFFASEEGSYTAIQEYTRLDGRDATDAAEITAHVPGFLPTGVSQLIPAPDLNAIIVIAANSANPERVYAYQYYWDGDRKIISAWRRWSFPGGQVLSGTFLDGKLHLVVRRSNKAYLEVIDLRNSAASAQQEHMIYLDRQVTLTGTYSAITGLTTFTFPYTPDPLTLRLVRTMGDAYPESLIDGSKVTVTGPTVTVIGDESAHPVTAGSIYRTAARLSRQFPRDYQDRPLVSGRLQLRTMTVAYTETPYFTVEVMPYGPKANISLESKLNIYQITGQRAGDTGLVTGAMSYSTNSSMFTVSADAAQVSITLANDTPFASYWTSAEWEGVFFSRARG